MSWDNDENPFKIFDDIMDKLSNSMGFGFGTRIVRNTSSKSEGDTPHMDYQYDDNVLTITLDMNQFTDNINVNIKERCILIDATDIEGKIQEYKIDVGKLIEKHLDDSWVLQKTTDFVSYNNGILTIKVKIKDKRIDIYG